MADIILVLRQGMLFLLGFFLGRFSMAVSFALLEHHKDKKESRTDES